MKYILILFLLIATKLLSSGQSFEIGLGYQNFNVKGRSLLEFSPSNQSGNYTYGEDVKTSLGSIGLLVGKNFPFFKPGDNTSFGIYGCLIGHMWIEKKEDAKNFSGQTIASGSSSGIFGYQVPVLATFRYGTHASEDADADFLFGTGIGATLSGFSIQDQISEQGQYITPTFMLEAGYNDWKVRFDYHFRNFQSNYKSLTGDIPRYTISNFAIHVILNISTE